MSFLNDIFGGKKLLSEEEQFKATNRSCGTLIQSLPHEEEGVI